MALLRPHCRLHPNISYFELKKMMEILPSTTVLPDRDVHTTISRGRRRILRPTRYFENEFDRRVSWCTSAWKGGAILFEKLSKRSATIGWRAASQEIYLSQIAGDSTSTAHKLRLDSLYFAIPSFRKRTLAHEKGINSIFKNDNIRHEDYPSRGPLSVGAERPENC